MADIGDHSTNHRRQDMGKLRLDAGTPIFFVRWTFHRAHALRMDQDIDVDLAKSKFKNCHNKSRFTEILIFFWNLSNNYSYRL